MKLQGLAQIGQGVVDGRTLAGYVDISRLRYVPVAFVPYTRQGQSSIGHDSRVEPLVPANES